MPLIEVHEVRSLGEIPSIDITFPNGMKDSVVLERFYPTKESRMATINVIIHQRIVLKMLLIVNGDM